jgi:predicted transcriptional regulator
MNVERGKLPLTQEEADRASDERAIADYRAGRFTPHSEVAKWLAKWKDGDTSPAPRPWLK